MYFHQLSFAPRICEKTGRKMKNRNAKGSSSAKNRVVVLKKDFLETYAIYRQESPFGAKYAQIFVREH